MTGKGKAKIYATTNSRKARLLQTKSASDVDGTKSLPRERTFNYDHELCHSMLSDSDDDILYLLKVFCGRMNRCFVHLP